MGRTTGTPRNAMLVQGAIALSLVVLGAILKGGFEGLVLYSAPVFWGFFLLTGVSLFVLRAKEPRRHGVRVPGYPFVPAIFVLSCAYLFYKSFGLPRQACFVGLGVLAVGAVVMLFAERARKAVSAPKAG